MVAMKQEMRQSQSLVMTQQLQQSIKLLQLSAVELQDDERASVLAMFEKQFGEKLIPHYRTDPAIRGGVIGRVKDLVYDGSLRGSLDKLRENLIQ
jgi:F-type H+-transporting ATPase subunit delta